jgi:hypothetical protein
MKFLHTDDDADDVDDSDTDDQVSSHETSSNHERESSRGTRPATPDVNGQLDEARPEPVPVMEDDTWGIAAISKKKGKKGKKVRSSIWETEDS